MCWEDGNSHISCRVCINNVNNDEINNKLVNYDSIVFTKYYQLVVNKCTGVWLTTETLICSIKRDLQFCHYILGAPKFVQQVNGAMSTQLRKLL